MSFDGYFYDNDFPNMSDVTELQCRRAGSDLTVDLSSPIYFIPRWYERGSVNQAVVESTFGELGNENMAPMDIDTFKWCLGGGSVEFC